MAAGPAVQRSCFQTPRIGFSEKIAGEGGEQIGARSWQGVSRASGTEGADAAQALIEELLHTAFSLGGAFVSLLEDLPEDAFAGEDQVAVLIEMLAGSSRPAIDAAGEEDCRVATALIGAVRDRVFDDLQAAARLAKPKDN